MKAFYVWMGTAAAVWLAAFFVIPWLWPAKPDAGQVGDSMNVVNSLFSAATLAGVIYTLYRQNEAEQKRDQDALEEKKLLREQIQAAKDALALEQRRFDAAYHPNYQMRIDGKAYDPRLIFHNTGKVTLELKRVVLIDPETQTETTLQGAPTLVHPSCGQMWPIEPVAVGLIQNRWMECVVRFAILETGKGCQAKFRLSHIRGVGYEVIELPFEG